MDACDLAKHRTQKFSDGTGFARTTRDFGWLRIVHTGLNSQALLAAGALILIDRHGGGPPGMSHSCLTSLA